MSSYDVNQTFREHAAHLRLREGSETCQNSFELVMLALTLPLWTFITLFIIVLLIHYLREMQYFTVYDKCTSRNAHFRYDFHMVCGKHSHNYNRNEYIILDLLDNHTVSTMTIQIPGQTIFNEHQIFMYRHSRDNLRCVQFTVYRRHPIKDVKSIRIAHSCSNTDSRLYIYGVDIYDLTNNENKFIPITSVVKYRGTQWALVTTFEPKPDMNFKRLGVDCHDPFGYSNWPTYLELLTMVLYIWCSSYCFGHLISVKGIAESVPLHALTILFIVATSSAVLIALYLRVIKNHIVSGHYDSSVYYFVQLIYMLLVLAVSLGFWTLALNQNKECRANSYQWLISTATSAIILTILLLASWMVAAYKRVNNDTLAQNATDAVLYKSNSKDSIQYLNDPVQTFCVNIRTTQESSTSKRANELIRQAAAKVVIVKNLKSVDQKVTKVVQAPARPARKSDERMESGSKRTDENETLDTAYNQGSKHMKVKNRNSISQYV